METLGGGSHDGHMTHCGGSHDGHMTHCGLGFGPIPESFWPDTHTVTLVRGHMGTRGGGDTHWVGGHMMVT